MKKTALVSFQKMQYSISHTVQRKVFVPMISYKNLIWHSQVRGNFLIFVPVYNTVPYIIRLVSLNKIKTQDKLIKLMIKPETLKLFFVDRGYRHRC
jgi:hypothetical protein